MFLTGAQDELSLLGVLKERAKEEDRWLFDQDYSDVLLVFDYEPQDNRFSPDRLEEMQRYFNESTDNGKLYVNYPMVEACKHFTKLPDMEFLERSVSLDGVPYYKETAGTESRYQSFDRDFRKPEVDGLIALTAIKAAWLARIASDEFAEMLGEIDHEAVLRAQNRYASTAQKVWVLGMCMMFIPDYSPDLIDFDRLKREHLI